MSNQKLQSAMIAHCDQDIRVERIMEMLNRTDGDKKKAIKRAKAILQKAQSEAFQLYAQLNDVKLAGVGAPKYRKADGHTSFADLVKNVAALGFAIREVEDEVGTVAPTVNTDDEEDEGHSDDEGEGETDGFAGGILVGSNAMVGQNVNVIPKP